MEKVRPAGVGQEQAEVPEWLDHEGEEWVAPEQVQAQQGSVFVLNAERSHPMKLESPVSLNNALNVGKRWSGNS